MSTKKDVYDSYKSQFEQMEKDYNKPYYHYTLFIANEIVEWLYTGYYDEELLHLYEETNLRTMTEALEEIYLNRVECVLKVLTDVLHTAHEEEKEMNNASVQS